MQPHNATNSGFTLLEMLVVFVLFSLVVMMLMQGLVYMNQLTSRASQGIQRYQTTTLETHWVQQLLAGLRPATRSEAGVFMGGEQQLSALSVQALKQPAGKMTPFTLVLSGNRLTYQEQGDTQATTIWEGTQEAKWFFRYRTPQGEWVKEWKPDPNLPQARHPLPTQVCLCSDKALGTIIPIEIDRFPPMDRRERQEQ